LSLTDAVRVGVFLKNPADAKEFDAIYAEYVGDPLPVRTLTQSSLVGFDIEVDAVLIARRPQGAGTNCPGGQERRCYYPAQSRSTP